MYLLRIALVSAVAGDGDQTLGLTADCGSLGLGGSNTLVRKELLDQVSAQRRTGTGRPTKSVS
jgi:hypothetical protein